MHVCVANYCVTVRLSLLTFAMQVRRAFRSTHPEVRRRAVVNCAQCCEYAQTGRLLLSPTRLTDGILVKLLSL